MVGGLEKPGALPKIPLVNMAGDVEIVSKPEAETLNNMLVNGDLDALVSPRIPSSFMAGDANVARLFPDFKSEELAYFRKTGIFPPMHCVVIRREVYQRNRWVAQSLYAAFDEAKRECTLDRMWNGHLRYTLPFLHAAVEESREIFGDKDPFVYGIEDNRHTLETLVQYSHEQGLIPERYDIDSLFAPEIVNASPN